MATLLEVENLGAFYGPTQALHGLTFGLEAGGITTLLGANGAGKTTTLRAISGLVKTTGEIRFEGGRIDGRKAEDIARRGIAHVPDGRGIHR
jgi:branched-chain amino acid transport system ATP-binding protein